MSDEASRRPNHRSANAGGSPRGAPSAPDERTLHEAALAALARRPLTEVGLRRVLERKLATWGRRAVRAGRPEEELCAVVDRLRPVVLAIVTRFAEVKLVDDAAFASARTRRLSNEGRSARAIQAHLLAKGVAKEMAREAVHAGASDELRAAIVLAKKRKVGPFAREPSSTSVRDELESAARRKALGMMARAGFEFSTVDRVLRMDREEAEELLADRSSMWAT